MIPFFKWLYEEEIMEHINEIKEKNGIEITMY